MKNFPIEKDGQTYWVSRSVACGAIVFGYDKNHKLHVLANKRGSGCEFNVGKWNIPGGFIDYDENALQCAIRECYEETGVKIDPEELEFLDINTEPVGARQTITVRFTGIISTPIEDIELTNEHSEPNEVEEIKWLPVQYQSDMDELKKMNWSRDQLRYIEMAYLYLVTKD